MGTTRRAEGLTAGTGAIPASDPRTMRSPTMRAVTIDRRGRVSLLDVPLPHVGPREVLIAVDTSGVGSWDASMRPEGRGRPDRAGNRRRGARDGGRIRGSDDFAPATASIRTATRTRRGAFTREFVAVVAKKVARVPRGLDRSEAGAIATTGLTALQGVDDALNVKKGRERDRAWRVGRRRHPRSPVREVPRRARARDRVRARWRRSRAPPRRRRRGRREAARHPRRRPAASRRTASTQSSRSSAGSRSRDASTL